MKIVKYPSCFRTEATEIELSWEELCDLLKIQSTQCHPCKVKSKTEEGCKAKFVEAWAPNILSSPQRKNENVEYVTALVLDCDKLSTESNNKLLNILDKLPYKYLLHSTHSDEAKAHCYRIILPYSSPVPSRDAKSIREQFLITHNLKSFVDPNAADLSRLFLLPTRSASKGEGSYYINPGPEYTPTHTKASSVPQAKLQSTQEPIDLDQARKILKTVRKPESRELTRRVLNGEAIAALGEQDGTLQKVCSVITFALGDSIPIDGVLALMDDSLRATEWLDGHEHLVAETRKKLERALEDFQKVKEERAQTDEQTKVTARQFAANLLAEMGMLAVAEITEDTQAGWKNGLQYSDGESSKLRPRSLNNCALIIENDPIWRGRFRTNTLKSRVEFFIQGKWQPLTDTVYTKLRRYITSVYGCEPVNKGDMIEIINDIASRVEFNPVTNYLDSLTWDGIPRIDGLFETYFNAKSVSGSDITPYLRKVSANFLISAVARAYKPGEKVDTCVVLEGEQSFKKSTMITALFGAGFVNDNKIDIENRDGKMAVANYWAVELAELKSIKRSDVESVKQFLTQTTDIMRLPYGSSIVEIPRRCIFIGTTNEDNYLQDLTGNRRFWPVYCGAEILTDELKKHRDELWAEAVVRHQKGERFWFDSKEDGELIAMARNETDVRMQDNVLAECVVTCWRQRKKDKFLLKEMMEWVSENEWLSPGERSQPKIVGALKAAGFVRRITDTTEEGQRVQFRTWEPGPRLQRAKDEVQKAPEFKDSNLLALMKKGEA